MMTSSSFSPPLSRGLYVLLIVVGLVMQECHSTIVVEVTPRESLVLPGQRVKFMCRVGMPLQYCRVEIPGEKTFNLNSQTTDSGFVMYYGEGLDAGQCGAIINGVQEKHNGKVKCSFGMQTVKDELSETMDLIVAKAPDPPILQIQPGTDSLHLYKINDNLQASCLVRNGRPVANISWFLDNEPILDHSVSMPTVRDLIKENLHSKVQNITRMLQASDNGRTLRCVAYHLAYPNDGTAEAHVQLDVKYPPLPQRDIDKFGYIIGQPGSITVQVESNPKPQIEWLIGAETIREGNSDSTGRIQAEAARDLGRGHYEINLRIAAINKQDTDKEYVLKVYNDMGSQDYSIKISTSPEPEGVELGIGGIIGIVIAILFILLVVFIVIFAKINGRWCFSGSSDTRHLGESSDTESADVRPREPINRNLSPINLTSFFKKSSNRGGNNKDSSPTTTTTTANDDVTKSPNDVDSGGGGGGGDDEADNKLDLAEDKPSSGDKSGEGDVGGGGLVYAELDLVNNPNNKMTATVKNADDKTEYAEIVYTPPPPLSNQQQETITKKDEKKS